MQRRTVYKSSIRRVGAVGKRLADRFEILPAGRRDSEQSRNMPHSEWPSVHSTPPESEIEIWALGRIDLALSTLTEQREGRRIKAKKRLLINRLVVEGAIADSGSMASGFEPATVPMEQRTQLPVECPQCHGRQFVEVELDRSLLMHSPQAQAIRAELEAWMASRCPDHLGVISQLSKN